MSSRCTVKCDCGTIALSGVFPDRHGNTRRLLTKACAVCRGDVTKEEATVERLDLVELNRQSEIDNRQSAQVAS